ncbi:MAG TPA: HAMP domain-containing protein, partial [Thermoanaerobaculia bacterium]|nr:HAMP domain-containing protein [Thermoanaerobaculia bacterium]
MGVTAFVCVAVTLAVARLGLTSHGTAAVALLVALPVALLAAHSFAARITRRLTALVDGVRGFRDEDFSLRLAVRGSDEITELIRAYNDIGDVLRAQRTDTVQKELLLDTILQGTPTAIILVNPAGRIVYANRSGRELIGHRVDGLHFDDVVGELPLAMRDAIVSGRDVLFTLPGADREETFHVTRRTFHLNTQKHTLVMIERLTPEVRRQEVEVWKKAIRTMNHELNNSLAPISSLMHTVRHVAGKPEQAHHLDDIYATIHERLQHLRAFLERYGEFARIPAPRRERVEWNALLGEVRALYEFQLERPAHGSANIDRGQMQQVLINLLKNAYESGSDPSAIAVEIARVTDGTQLRVLDRGRGMPDDVRRQAM